LHNLSFCADLGAAFDIASLVMAGGDAINYGPNDDPGKVLDEMRQKGASDIDISFVAMQYMIIQGVKLVEEAIKDIMKIQNVGCMMVLMPWKVSEQNEIGERLQGYYEALDKFNVQLQCSISVASYCISLEQLENALNATKMLACKGLR
jgi:hypothetical protein